LSLESRNSASGIYLFVRWIWSNRLFQLSNWFCSSILLVERTFWCHSM